MIGTILGGRYRIDRLLGAGAMGSVFEAEHTATGRRVAVKVISSGDMVRDKKLVARFQREARAAGAVDTQHITQILDSGEDESGTPYLVMEMLHGEDLSHTIKRLGPLSPELALRVTAQTCIGLAKAHEAGVVHRDIKPANLFLAKRDAGEIIVKLLDFGVAKVKMDQANDAEGAALTKTGSMLGSPLYMSPEQAKGLKSIDHRADIWSLGVVLFQALSGRTPYDHCEALGGLIISICHEDVRSVQEIAPWVPPEVAAIVHKAIVRDPSQRFQTAMEMLDAVRALLPGGWALSEEMFMPLSQAVKASVAPRFGVSGSLPPPPGGSVRPPPPGVSLRPPSMPSFRPPSLPSVPPPGAASTGSGRTADALVQSQRSALVQSQGSALAQSQGSASQAQPPQPSRAPLIAAMAALAAVIGAGSFLALRPHVQPQQPVASLTVTATATAAPVPTPAAPTATATEAPRTVDISLKRTKVVIVPSDAFVEVDGTRTPARGGLAEVNGVLGSAHRVRVWKGRVESVVEVKITEDGASPPKIELGASPPKK